MSQERRVWILGSTGAVRVGRAVRAVATACFVVAAAIDYSCVSRSTWLAAGAAEQRFVAGILAAFFVMHFGMAAAEPRRRGVEPVA